MSTPFYSQTQVGAVSAITTVKLTRGVTEFDTYIRNNQKFIPNFGERYSQEDTIRTAFVESAIN